MPGAGAAGRPEPGGETQGGHRAGRPPPLHLHTAPPAGPAARPLPRRQQRQNTQEVSRGRG